MSLSKPKRSSFRIDDILSLKTTSPNETTDQSSDIDVEDKRESPENIHRDHLLPEDLSREMNIIRQRLQIQQRNSHSSLLQEIGNRKRRREEIAELDLSKPQQRDVIGLSKDSIDSDASSKLYPIDNDAPSKIYPLAPRPTKLPTSLESLMRTHAHDYLLKLPGAAALNPWTMLSNPCLRGVTSMLPPPLLELPSPGGSHRTAKNCICGSVTCTGIHHRGDGLSHHDGPSNFLRPAHSPSSPNQEPPSIPIPLPVYVRTRDVASHELGGSKPKKCRRSRTVFTELQLMGLEKKFETQKYLSTPDRLDIADRLGLTQLQVKTWYQNRRMKWKKQVLQGGGTEAPTKPKGRPRKDSLGYGDGLSSPSNSPSAAMLPDSEDDDEDGELSDV